MTHATEAGEEAEYSTQTIAIHRSLLSGGISATEEPKAFVAYKLARTVNAAGVSGIEDDGLTPSKSARYLEHLYLVI